jgi:hypothetical protein
MCISSDLDDHFVFTSLSLNSKSEHWTCYLEHWSPKSKDHKFRKGVKGSSMNDVTVLGGESQALSENNTKYSVIKSVTIRAARWFYSKPEMNNLVFSKCLWFWNFWFGFWSFWFYLVFLSTVTHSECNLHVDVQNICFLGMEIKLKLK